MAYISDVGKVEEVVEVVEEEEEEEEGKKRTEFKHIRERRCLKNNHGARKREGREGERKGRNGSAREQRGWPGSTTGAINSSPSRPRWSVSV